MAKMSWSITTQSADMQDIGLLARTVSIWHTICCSLAVVISIANHGVSGKGLGMLMIILSFAFAISDWRKWFGSLISVAPTATALSIMWADMLLVPIAFAGTFGGFPSSIGTLFIFFAPLLATALYVGPKINWWRNPK